MTLSSGTRLGRYEIRAKIGEGGMGEVYLAQDTKLDRRVALKILPADVADDRSRMSRFVQEAKAASALNHPNIITIHEIDQADPVHFIATEFIDGETMRRRMRNAPMKLSGVLDVAIQTSSALSAAHAADIVHRDIKPENIMIRRDGIVKVLDFGLAKLTERRPPDAVNGEAPTSLKTDPGTVVGTAVYMSPEQARGLNVDARTDIWSLGVVIYEMVAGCLPFAGTTPREVLASVLGDRETQPLARYSREAPAELERIVSKALRKNRDERYQTIKDMLLDLQSLKQRLEFEVELERSAPPAVKDATTMSVSAAVETKAASVLPASSVELIIAEIKRHQRSVTVALAGLVLLSLAGIAYFFYFVPGVKAIDSIAVLPFVNASADPQMDYLSEGISETLINSLTQLQQLRVVARSTAFRYRGKEDPRAVGRDLNVRAVLMGRVRQTGDSLNIQVDLVDATTGAQLWGQEYDCKISDVVAVKQDIAREVTEKLRLRLSGAEQQRLARQDTANPEAYQLYLKGRYYWNQRTAEGMKKAIEQFQKAADKDPNYALAYVGLADCYSLLPLYPGTPPLGETNPKARAAVLRALQIDDSLAEAHASMAKIYESSWQFEEARKEFIRAIELNPNYPTAHHWYSLYLASLGRPDDALAEMKRAQQLDPLSTIFSGVAALFYLQKGDLSGAIEQCKGIVELDPNSRFAPMCVGRVYEKQGRFEEAIGEFRKAVALSGESENLSALGHCYAISGRRSEAMATLKELEQRYAKGESPGFHVAAVYAGLGEKDLAFVWLEKDFQSRIGQLFQITFLPTFETLRSDPRYADLLRRMGLRPQ